MKCQRDPYTPMHPLHRRTVLGLIWGYTRTHSVSGAYGAVHTCSAVCASVCRKGCVEMLRNIETRTLKNPNTCQLTCQSGLSRFAAMAAIRQGGY